MNEVADAVGIKCLTSSWEVSELKCRPGCCQPTCLISSWEVSELKHVDRTRIAGTTNVSPPGVSELKQGRIHRYGYLISSGMSEVKQSGDPKTSVVQCNLISSWEVSELKCAVPAANALVRESRLLLGGE